MYNKRYELEKLSENEKMKAALKFYEIGLKEKLKKKVDNVILNQSIDIKDSINEKNILKFTKSQKKPSGSNFFYEDSSEKINPMSLLDENLKNTKEEIKTSIIDSNDVQIKKIRNEINNLKEIINVFKI